MLGPDAESEARRVREFAEKTENWYRPGPGAKVPGEDPRHVLTPGTYRAVFSWTVDQAGRPHRHLSVSVGRPGKAPIPMVVFTIAHWLGFTGTEPDEDGIVQTFGDHWVMWMDPVENTACVSELVEGP